MYPDEKVNADGIHSSGPVTIGSLFHSFPVRLISVSTKLKSCDPPVTPAIERDSLPPCLDGIHVHCPPVPAKASYFCGSDVLGK